MHRRIALLLCWCTASGLPAQAAPSGVLLGLQQYASHYHTYWITRSDSGARIASTLPGIVVKRASRFWHVGVTTVCEFDGYSNGTRDVVWEAPLGRRPTVHSHRPCVTRAAVRDCDRTEALVRFVSPVLISETETSSQTEECEPRGGRWSTVSRVRKLGRADPLDLSAFVADSAADMYWRAVQTGFAAMQREGMNCPELLPEDALLTSWTVTHTAGAWHPVANYNNENGVGLGECEVEQALDVAMPPRATGDATSDELFRRVRQHVPELRDLLPAPSGTWAVAVLEVNNVQSIAIYEIENDRLGRKLLDFEINNVIVSAQWASGRHVAQWSAALAR